jgi:flagellar hook protein FlgE
MDPTDDVRSFGPAGADTVPDAKKGLLMAGTITFNSSGLMTDMSAFVPNAGGANFANMTDWVAAPISSNGYPMFAANFSGQHESSKVWADLPATQPSVTGPGEENPNVVGRLTELNLGFRSKNDWWSFGTGGVTMDTVGSDYRDLAGMGTAGERQNPASTAYKGSGSNFYERYAKQDGYSYGELSSIHVTENGVLTGRYSNGVTLELFQITLYDFNAKHELHREGGNLFTQTRESGDPTQGAAKSGSFGSILGNNIEQSNVDLAREFVQMITTQRGFQSNSKLITTTDPMLENVINMKRL